MTLGKAAGMSRRERQILDVLYERGSASAAEVCEALPDAPSYSAVRALLRILEEKGYAGHAQEGPRYIYRPLEPATSAARQAMERVVRTFFAGSVEQAVSTLISESEARLSDDEFERLEEIIRNAREGSGR